MKKSKKLKIPTMQLTVRDISWKFEILPSDLYDKIHGNSSDGLADSDTRTVSFRDTAVNQQVVLHELFHVYIETSHLHNVEFKDDRHSIEEHCCDIVSNHIESILKNAKIISKKLNIKK